MPLAGELRSWVGAYGGDAEVVQSGNWRLSRQVMLTRLDDDLQFVIYFNKHRGQLPRISYTVRNSANITKTVLHNGTAIKGVIERCERILMRARIHMECWSVPPITAELGE
jgi:hypothetical protein